MGGVIAGDAGGPLLGLGHRVEQRVERDLRLGELLVPLLLAPLLGPLRIAEVAERRPATPQVIRLTRSIGMPLAARDAAIHCEVPRDPAVDCQRRTGADGTPSDFVVLASADLRHWRVCGQGGAATMGIMRRGAGTVFNAGTIGWAGALDDPVVDRITRTVLDRLGGVGPRWARWAGC